MKAKDRCKANWQGDKCRLALNHANAVHKGNWTSWTDLLGRVNVVNPQDELMGDIGFVQDLMSAGNL